MQINLKQRDIEQALKGYIAAQGIALAGKEVSISFTAGRKSSGITAELTILEAEEVQLQPAADVIKKFSAIPVVEVQAVMAEAATEKEVASDFPEVVEEPTTPETPPTGSSLFA